MNVRSMSRRCLSNAGVGAATFGGSIADGISVTKTDGGTWTFAPQGDSVGAVSFNAGNAGTLVVGTNLTMASVSVASSSATLFVAAGKALTISGGTFATTNSVILGRDGTGVLTLSGAGVLKAATIDVRQTDGAEASEIRFVADANGKCGKIDAATKLKFAAGSRVVVDVSAVSAENPKSVVLWDLDEAPTGLTEEMLVLQGNGSVAIENGLKLENGGRRLAWRVTRGAVLIIR